MVPLPTPPGPDTTMMSGGCPGAGDVTQSRAGFEQRLALLRAEALDPAVVGDADLLHDLAGLDLAPAGQRFEQRDDLELADVGVVGGEGVGERHRVVLQPRLDLGPGRTGFGGLRQCRGTLLGSQLRRCSHAGHGTRKPAAVRVDGTAVGGDVMSPRARRGSAPAHGDRRTSPCRPARRRRRRAAARWRPSRVATPPTPTIGRSGWAAWTSCTARTATGWIAGPGQPAAAGAERRLARRRVVGQAEQRVDAASPPRRRPRRRRRRPRRCGRCWRSASPSAAARTPAVAAIDLGRQLGVVGEDGVAALEVRARQVDLDGDDAPAALRRAARRPAA